MSEKKQNLIIIILAIITVILVGVAMLDTNSSKELTKENLENLISSKYEITDFNINEKDINVVIKGNLTKEELTELSKNMFFTVKYDNHVKQQDLNFVLIDENSQYSDEFYYDGIIYKGDIYLDVGELNLYDFKNVEASASSDLREYSSQKLVSADNNNLKINVNMDLDGLSESDILAQMKTYTDLFKRTNSDKEIKSVELSIYGNKSKYKYSSNFENILLVSEKIKLL